MLITTIYNSEIDLNQNKLFLHGNNQQQISKIASELNLDERSFVRI